MFYLSISMVIAASVSYHLAQKYTAQDVNPVLVLLLTYMTAFIASTGLFVFFPLKESFDIEVRRLSGASVALGLAIIGIEIGWLLAYRAGWNVNAGSLVANLVVAIVLLPVGLLLFKEHLSLTNIIGVGLCIVGLVLVNKV